MTLSCKLYSTYCAVLRFWFLHSRVDRKVLQIGRDPLKTIVEFSEVEVATKLS